jgi:hypothetical protein
MIPAGPGRIGTNHPLDKPRRFGSKPNIRARSIRR